MVTWPQPGRGGFSPQHVIGIALLQMGRLDEPIAGFERSAEAWRATGDHRDVLPLLGCVEASGRAGRGHDAVLAEQVVSRWAFSRPTAGG